MFKYWLVVLVMCVNLFMYNSVHACVFGVKCGPEDAIDDAIEAVKKESGDWRAFLREAMVRLPEEAQSTIRNEINTTLINAIAAGGITAKCAGEFFKGSFLPELSSLKRALLGNKPVVRMPTFCLVTPNNIDYKRVKGGGSNIISITGYNLFNPNFRVHILNNKKQKRDVTNTLSRTTHYQVSLNLGQGAIGSLITPNDRKVIVTVNDRIVSEIPIIHPIPPAQRPNYDVTIHTGRVDKAGTDAAVYIALQGTHGRTKEKHLDTANHDDFQYGSVRTYTIVPLKDIGEISRVYIRHDNRGKELVGIYPRLL